MVILRVFIAIGFALLTSVQAWACDCVPWEGYVSELTEKYISFWGAPTNATVNIENLGKPLGGVTYTVDIIEAYGRVSQKTININANVANNSGNCGVPLNLGVAQFITAHHHGDRFYSVSSCTPKLPYSAVRHYLETGEDSFIPSWGKCHSWYEYEYNTELEACEIWKGADPIHGVMGAEDQRKYSKIWWDKIESAEPKKKRRRWQYKETDRPF